ncbi:MAG: SDR family oxidoreductase [Candidatus Nanoarchaeia archaeon]
MKYVVTGGAGFIGSHIVEELVSRGETVIVIDDLSTGSLDNLSRVVDKIAFIKGSILDRDLLETHMVGVDFVLHLAAFVSVAESVDNPMLCHNINSTGTLNVLMAAKKCGVKRVIYSSSAAVYGDDPVLPKKEDMLPSPKSPYAASKLSGEYYCYMFNHLYGLETVVLRYFNVYGPRQRADSEYAAVIPKFVDAIKSGRQPMIFGDGRQTRDFCFVSDVVNANLLSCSSSDAPGKVFNIANGRTLSILQVLSVLCTSLGKDVNPVHKEERAGDIKHSSADIVKAEKMLSYRPDISFEEGIRKIVHSVGNIFK